MTTGPLRSRTAIVPLVLLLVITAAVLILVLRPTRRNPGTGDGVIQVYSSMTSDPQSATGDCVIHEKMAPFNQSADFCKRRNSRLLNERDMKAPCIIPGEDFWAAPMDRDPAGCFIYNTDHGFLRMDCLTPHWFICVED